MRNAIRKLTTLCLAIALSACSTTTQTTSGEEYLNKYPAVGTSSTTGGSDNFEETLRKVAAVEPTLRFPAKIGLARIDQGRLTTIPAEELKTWMKMRDNLGGNNSFGEFVLVNPMIAEMLSGHIKSNEKYNSLSPIDQIRLAGARQHLDAVLIYEIATTSQGKDNLLEIGNLTIIGTFLLPSETVEAEAYASALLIDVLQAYPYGTADIAVEKRKGYATNNDSGKRGQEMQNEMKTAATEKLAPEVENLFKKVRAELEAKKTKDIAKKE